MLSPAEEEEHERGVEEAGFRIAILQVCVLTACVLQLPPSFSFTRQRRLQRREESALA